MSLMTPWWHVIVAVYRGWHLLSRVEKLRLVWELFWVSLIPISMTRTRLRGPMATDSRRGDAVYEVSLIMVGDSSML